MKIINLERAILEARKLAESRLAEGENADEFVPIGNADDFKMYVTAGKTVKVSSVEGLHENPRDIFMLVLEGEIEFAFEEEEKTRVKAGECFVLPKDLKHRCFFKKMTVAIEGVYEKTLRKPQKKRLGLRKAGSP